MWCLDHQRPSCDHEVTHHQSLDGTLEKEKEAGFLVLLLRCCDSRSTRLRISYLVETKNKSLSLHCLQSGFLQLEAFVTDVAPSSLGGLATANPTYSWPTWLLWSSGLSLLGSETLLSQEMNLRAETFPTQARKNLIIQ